MVAPGFAGFVPEVLDLDDLELRGDVNGVVTALDASPHVGDRQRTVRTFGEDGLQHARVPLQDVPPGVA
jgi:hypothetical protein